MKKDSTIHKISQYALALIPLIKLAPLSIQNESYNLLAFIIVYLIAVFDHSIFRIPFLVIFYSIAFLNSVINPADIASALMLTFAAIYLIAFLAYKKFYQPKSAKQNERKNNTKLNNDRAIVKNDQRQGLPTQKQQYQPTTLQPASIPVKAKLLYPKLLKELQSREIKALVHFTRAENLENIMIYGLCSREVLNRTNVKYRYSDKFRHDACMDAIFTSIEFPNYQMFYKKQLDAPAADWVVLLIDASVLGIRKSRFYKNNSAGFYDCKPCRFYELFDDFPTREAKHLPPYYPTNPQAEVHVIDHIPAEYIKYIAFKDESALCKYMKYIPKEIKAECNTFYFQPRMDWKYNKESLE